MVAAVPSNAIGRMLTAAKLLCTHAERYNHGVWEAKRYTDEGRVLILSPDDITGLGTLRCNHSGLERLYRKGLQDSRALLQWLE